MTGDQIVQLITAIGFPAVCLVVLGKWVGRRIEKSEEASLEREKQCLEREEKMGVKIDLLQGEVREVEKYIRTELLEYAKENKYIVNEARAAIGEASETLKDTQEACHSLMALVESNTKDNNHANKS